MTQAPSAAVRACWRGRDTPESRPRHFLGALAGLLAQTAVYPLDVVRRRMQMHDGKTALYSSPWSAVATIAREEGLRGGLLTHAHGALRFECCASSCPRLAVEMRAAPLAQPLRGRSAPSLTSPLGLYRGLSLNWLKTMPNVAIYMSLYDILKLQLRGRLTHD